MKRLNIQTNDDLIKGLLTRDSISRTQRSWKILNDKELENIWNETSIFRKSVHIEGVSYVVLPKRFGTKEKIFKIENFSWKDVMNGNKSTLNFGESLNDSHIFIVELLQQFKGKIVACGGSIFRNLYHKGGMCYDIDLFFVDSNVYNNTNREVYDNLLIQSLRFLIEKFMATTSISSITRKDDVTYTTVESIINNNVHIVRNEYVTTLYLCADGVDTKNSINHHNDFVYKYQLIHRVYPNVGSILGGFDLGPCMIAFDGYRILATELGAWSAFAKTVIVDTKRRSTTFEKRLAKYNDMCNIVLPGLRRNVMTTSNLFSNVSLEKMIQIIIDFCKLKGYKCKYGKGFKFKPMINSHSLSKDELEVKILKLLNASRYNLESETDKSAIFSDFWQHFHFSDNEIEKCTVVRLQLYLVDLCKYYDFIWDIDDHILYKRTIIRLPKVNLNIKKKIDRQWNISPAKVKFYNTNLLNSTPSLFSLDISEKWFSNYQTNKLDKVSDYEDNNVYPNFMENLNATSLRCNKLQAVAAIVRINFTTNPTLNNIENIIRSSIASPTVGDVHSDFQKRLNIFLNMNTTNPFYFELHNNTNFSNFKPSQYHIEKIKNKLTKLFGRYSIEVYNLMFETPVDDKPLLTKLQPYIDLINEEFNKNIQICEDNLKGIKWITENPGRQWTSSINPVIEDPREWYGKNYLPFITGFSEYEKVLRLIRKRSNIWKILNKDIFNVVLTKFIVEQSKL